MALKRQWGDIIKSQVAGKEDFVFGQIHKGIPKGMGRTKVAQFNISAGLVEDQTVFKRHLRDFGFELRELFGKAWDALLELLDRDASPQLLFTAERMADDLRIPKQKVPAAVIHMMMGIH